MDVLTFGRYQIQLSHTDKVLFPKSRITKRDLISYYAKIGPLFVTYANNRPITMVRYPNGIDHEGFFQKDAGSYFPAWIQTKPIQKEDGTYTNYVIINNTATLVYLANQGCITPHIWLSKIDKLTIPDRMIFDFDPSGSDFNLVRAGAFAYKALLDKLGLPSFLMTTGSRGVHVIVPIRREKNFEWVRAFAYDMAQYLVAQHPDIFTLAMRKKDRGNLVFLDTLRNAFGQTGVAPYAVRPRPGASIATPITWQELGDKAIKPNSFTIKNIFNRLDDVGDLFRGMSKRAISLVRARKNFDAFSKKTKKRGPREKYCVILQGLKKAETKQMKHTLPIFVIQKHDASHLHYDVRLEVDGVLKSWAVPKGPSTDPKIKRLAVETADHPMDYADFEGIIPEGYGAGTVMVWDIGTYKNLRSVSMLESYDEGKIVVHLDGKKLQGGYALVRTKQTKENKPFWLLIKERDTYANKPVDPVKNEPNSVLTGRSLEEIRKDS